MKQRFRVYNIHAGDHIAVIECPEELLAPEAEILDHGTMTLRGIKNGGVFTLLPVDDHTVATLNRIKEVYENITTKPASLLSTHIHRYDNLVEIVGLLFGKVSYMIVESKSDLEKIINPPKDYEPRMVEYTVLGDLLKDAEKKAGVEEEVVKEEHKCGPGCSHDEK